jgi:hypothetical protein
MSCEFLRHLITSNRHSNSSVAHLASVEYDNSKLNEAHLIRRDPVQFIMCICILKFDKLYCKYIRCKKITYKSTKMKIYPLQESAISHQRDHS